MSFTIFYVVSSLNQNESVSWRLNFLQDLTCWNSKIYFALTVALFIKPIWSRPNPYWTTGPDQIWLCKRYLLVPLGPDQSGTCPCARTILAAFRYPHSTRPNSGPDQIILVLKLGTEPVRSWCCLHIHANFWSAAAVGISGPISVS